MNTQAKIRKQANIEEDLLLAETLKTGKAADKNTAFNIIVGKYYNQVLFRINGYVHNMTVAEDLTQETFAKVFTSIKHFKANAGAFSTWINTIANNNVIDHVRKEKRFNPVTFSKLSEQVSQTNEEGDSVAFELPSTETPFDEVRRKEIRTVVSKALKNTDCSEQDQRIFRKICVGGISYDEVSEAEGIPLNTIKSIVFRTKEKIKDYITAYSPEFQLAL